MRLRLRNVDNVFEKIVFYDADNIDIEFDISDKQKRKTLYNDLLNIHEGMLYEVKFTIIGNGTLGGLIGELQGFSPVIIEKIPEINYKEKKAE